MSTLIKLYVIHVICVELNVICVCTGSWVCTCRWFWLSESSCESSSAGSRTPSCSKSCPMWTESSSSAPTSSWSERLANWTWRKTSTPSSSSSTALQKPWSNGPERRTSEDEDGDLRSNSKLTLRSTKQELSFGRIEPENLCSSC